MQSPVAWGRSPGGTCGHRQPGAHSWVASTIAQLSVLLSAGTRGGAGCLPPLRANCNASSGISKQTRISPTTPEVVSIPWPAHSGTAAPWTLTRCEGKGNASHLCYFKPPLLQCSLLPSLPLCGSGQATSPRYLMDITLPVLAPCLRNVSAESRDCKEGGHRMDLGLGARSCMFHLHCAGATCPCSA